MTRLIEILISLAIVAALFLVVGIALPSSRYLEASAETNRKPTIVFDTLNSFRRFKDWNVLYLHDPSMRIQLAGPEAGVGARFEYASDDENVGSGAWEIVESEPNKRVAYKIQDTHPGTNKRTEFTLTPTGQRGRNIEVTQTYEVDYGWNLFGRYSGMYLSSSFGEDMKMGLQRLSNLLATVPNFDYSTLGQDDPSQAPKVTELPAQNVLALAAAVPRGNEEVQKQMKINMEWIKKVMEANGLETAGPVRVVTNELGSENYSFEIQQPVRKKAAGPGAAQAAGAGEGAVATAGEGAAPAGPATKMEGLKLSNDVTYAYLEPRQVAAVAFTGHMANLPRVRDALRAWVLTRGYQTVDRPYEDWKGGIDAGFTEEGTYDVYWTIKR